MSTLESYTQARRPLSKLREAPWHQHVESAPLLTLACSCGSSVGVFLHDFLVSFAVQQSLLLENLWVFLRCFINPLSVMIRELCYGALNSSGSS